MPAGAVSGPVQVTNAAGTGASAPFTVLVRPDVTTVAPPAGAVGTRVTLTGSGFTGATGVSFGGAPAWPPALISDGSIQIDVPAGAATGRIRVTHPAGDADSPLDFTVLTPPDIPTLDPPHGMVGATIVLRGARLAQVTQVRFGAGAAAAILAPRSDTGLPVRVPAGAADGPIEVDYPGGSASTRTAFKLLQPLAPQLLSMDPDHGIPGTRVTLRGHNLLGIDRAAFGGSAARFASVSDDEVTVTVPDAASPIPCFINVHTGRHPAAVDSLTRFTVDRPPPMQILGVHPDRGQAGLTTVVITGEHFHWIWDVKIGRYTLPAGDWKVDSSRQITAKVPPHAVPGRFPVTLSRIKGQPAGAAPIEAHSRNLFRVLPSAPVITRILPARSRPGFEVIIKGSGFTRRSTRVLFNATPATAVRRISPDELAVRVPAGASEGPVEVVTAQGQVFSPEPFRVDASADPSADVFIDGWYITQGAQDYAGTVPLVAGRSGLLRVFLRANRANHARPVLRATLAAGGRAAWTVDIAAPRTVPADPDGIREGLLGASWNAEIPAAELIPGRTLRLELDRAGGLAHADRTGNATDRPLDIRALPPLRITLVPVRQVDAHGRVLHEGRVDTGGRTLADWTRDLLKLYPLADVGGVDIEAGAVLTTGRDLAGNDEAEWIPFLDELDARRTRDGELDRIYVGVLGHSHAGVKGLTLGMPASASAMKVSLVTDGAASYQGLFAHEMGHAMGLLHAPYHAPDNERGYWPEDLKYDRADIGIWGYDRTTRTLMDPAVFKDIMSYGNARWISDFSYRKAITFLEGLR